MDHYQFNAHYAHDENERLGRLLIHFRGLLDDIPDNSDPESDDAIELQILLARIAAIEAGKAALIPVGHDGATEYATFLAGPEVAPVARSVTQDGVPPPAVAPTQLFVERAKEEREIRIVVIDDLEPVRLGFKVLLETRPGWKVVAEADNGETAVETVKQHLPDIVLMNLSMPGRLDGLAATREIVRKLPNMRVMIHTMHASKQLVREILEVGARGHLMPCDAPRDLIIAVETILDGKLFFTQTISGIPIDGFLEKPHPIGTQIPLTNREIDIVSLLAHGRSNKEVATELNISLRTAETHRANIMNKLQLRSIQDLVRYAVKTKLIEL